MGRVKTSPVKNRVSQLRDAAPLTPYQSKARTSYPRQVHGGKSYKPKFHTLQQRRKVKLPAEPEQDANNVIPRNASMVFKTQKIRRQLWMLVAQSKQRKPLRARKLFEIISKVKKTLRNLSRKERREQEHKIRQELLVNANSCMSEI